MHTLERVVSSVSSYYARARNRAMPVRAWLGLACAVLSLGALAIRARAAYPPAPGSEVDPVQEMLLVDPVKRLDAEKRILAAGPRMIPKLISAIRGDRSRSAIQRLITRMGPAAIPVLIETLGDEAIGQKTGSMLYSVIGPESLDQTPALIDCAATKPEVKNYCGTALVKIMSPKAAGQIPALRKALKSPVPELRMYAVAALAKVGPAARSAGPDMAALLKDSEPQVRLGAALSLGELGGQSAVVKKALQDLSTRKGESPEIRREAQKAARRWNA